MEVKFPSYFHLKWKHLTSTYVRGLLVKFTGLLLIVLGPNFLKGISTCKDRIYMVGSYGTNSGLLNFQIIFEILSEKIILLSLEMCQDTNRSATISGHLLKENESSVDSTVEKERLIDCSVY